ncbi:unnamed protein product [Angiostrongylus costaricensis]|uniref:Ubiquitinyl hydrolase 1 n=1 Tax=Angiostrongylus costaricensis TaxID=334426 RepID=A0A0R3PPR9_ANGCS|nr:unnamed protein product [Angiostrongylus costaricensis]
MQRTNQWKLRRERQCSVLPKMELADMSPHHSGANRPDQEKRIQQSREQDDVEMAIKWAYTQSMDELKMRDIA